MALARTQMKTGWITECIACGWCESPESL